MDPVTPQRVLNVPTQLDETPASIARVDSISLNGDPASQLKRQFDDKMPAAKRKRVQSADPAKIAEKEAAKLKKVEEKAQAKAKQAEEKEAVKKASNAAKEADKSARDFRKMVGDVLKSKLKGKKKRVNGRRTYSVPGSTVVFQHVSQSDFDLLFSRYGMTVKRNGSKCMGLKEGQMQEIFGKTKCQGGSMYSTFEISTANITYERSEFNNDMQLKITYKTQCVRESFW